MIAETLRVISKIQADSLDEAYEKYDERCEQVFDGYHTSGLIEIEGGENLKAYVLDENGEFQDAE